MYNTYVRGAEPNLQEPYCRKSAIYTNYVQNCQIFEISDFCSITPASIADRCRCDAATVGGLGVSDLCYFTEKQIYAIYNM